MSLNSLWNKLLMDYFRITATVVVAIILLAGYFGLISSRVSQLQTSGYLQRNQVAANLKSKQSELSQLKNAIDKYDRVLPKEKIDIINDFLPTGDDFPALVLTIQDIAQSANLDLSALAIGLVSQSGGSTAAVPDTAASAVAQAAAVPGADVQTKDVSITVEHGKSYQNFKRFISLLESSRRLFDVVSLSFTNQVSDDGSVDATYAATLRTYYLPAK